MKAYIVFLMTMILAILLTVLFTGCSVNINPPKHVKVCDFRGRCLDRMP